MKRALAVAAAALAAVAVAVAGVLWSWTRTPHGRLDVGAAIVARLVPSGLELTPETRARANAWTRRMAGGEAEPGVAVRDLVLPGPAGELPLRLYTPAGEGPFPLVLWIHGGGFWMGDDLPTWDRSCSRLALGARALVASIGYRLAPEHPFPAAVDDVYAGLLFVAAQARAWRGDPSRLAVMGGSAGGNLAAATALRARDEAGPRIRFQVLLVPGLNAGGEPTESMRLFSEGYGLAGIPNMRAAYFPDPEARKGPWASPLLAPDLSGLPPALVVTAEFDPLRDEGEAYAERLRRAGVPVTLRRFDGAIHGLLGSPDDLRASEALTVEHLRAAFGS